MTPDRERKPFWQLLVASFPGIAIVAGGAFMVFHAAPSWPLDRMGKVLATIVGACLIAGPGALMASVWATHFGWGTERRRLRLRSAFRPVWFLMMGTIAATIVVQMLGLFRDP
jgi:hypothetical protein